MNYPIAMIPYANMAPYEQLGPPQGCYFVHCTPRNSIDALRSGAVLAAAVPVGGLTRLEGVVEPLGLFGIAAHREVMSVLFFSDHALDAFNNPALTVSLTDESASSVRLLYLLMGYTQGFDRIPQLAAPGAPANGELLIGDAALKWHHQWEERGEVKSYRIVTDLAAQWDRHHQLPFVFARWVVRSDAPEAVKQSLKSWLDVFAGREPELIAAAAPKLAARLNLPHEYVARYLKVIRRCLTAEDQTGQERFHDEWQRHTAGHPASWFQTGAGAEAHRIHQHERHR